MTHDAPTTTGSLWFDAINLDDVPLLDVTALTALVDGSIPDVSNSEGLCQAEQSCSGVSKTAQRVSKEDRRQIERVRNRAIQARYRQRQKEKQDELVVQHEAAVEDLQRQRAEYQQLTHRNRILESVLSIREDAKGILQGAKSPPHRSRSAPSLSPFVSTYARHGGFWGSSPPDAHQADSVADEVAVVQDGHRAEQGQERLGQEGQRAEQGQEGSGQERLWQELISRGEEQGGGGSALLTRGAPEEGQGRERRGEVGGALDRWLEHESAQHAQQLREQLLLLEVPADVVEAIKACTPDAYEQNWIEFAGRLRSILARYDATHRPQELAKLAPLLRKRAIFMTLMLHHNMSCLRDFFARSCAQQQPPQQEFWDRLVASMQITPSQQGHTLHLWQAYLKKVSSSRAACNSALGLIRQASQESLEGGGIVSFTGKASPYLQLLEGAVNLSSFADLEFEALLELLCATGKVLTPLQKARMAAWSYPHFPDILAIVQAIQRLSLEKILPM